MDNFTNLTWCYQILELTADATEQEIKLAYRKLARKYHPDLNPGDRNAEDRFKQVAQAYQT
ncbi:J domain-containing protein, partial [Listeria monocytogenes]|uniref:J domain-containing protein n=1 Tax=Listeria monocytogenes TaxID=1639 RepID=UPI00122E6D4E